MITFHYWYEDGWYVLKNGVEIPRSGLGRHTKEPAVILRIARLEKMYQYYGYKTEMIKCDQDPRKK